MGTSGARETFLPQRAFRDWLLFEAARSSMKKEGGILMYRSQRSVLFVGLTMLFLLAGCGHNTGNGSPPSAASPTVPPSPGSVVLQVGAASYRAGDSIRVTILNQSQQTISFADHQTNCSVLLMEHQVGSSWEPVAPCKLMIATRLHSLQAGAKFDANLTPSFQWPTGTYRARLDYHVQNASAPQTVYSSTFLWTDGGQSI